MTISATASFPKGWEGRYVSVNDINDRLRGRSIESVEFRDHNTIAFKLDDGSTMVLNPCGLEGDDLELHIEPTLADVEVPAERRFSQKL